MNEKHKKALEWIESLKKEPTMKQIEAFSGSDLELKAICVCIIDPEQKDVYSSRKNKNELTQRTPKDAFETWVHYPEWFFVFVPKNPTTLLFMYGAQVEDIFELGEELLDENSYVESLIEYGVFEPVMIFKSVLDCNSNSLNDFLESVQEQIVSLNELKIEETSVNKFKFFKLDTLIEPDKNLIKTEYKNFQETFEKFEEVIKLFKIDEFIGNQEEVFKNFMPRTINSRGTFSMNSKSNYVGYCFDQNFSSILEDKLRAEASSIEAKNKEMLKKKAELSLTIAKTGISFIEKVFPPAAIISGISDVINTIDKIKEVNDFKNNTIHLTSENFVAKKTGEPLLSELLIDFNKSGLSSFKEFLIKDLKNQVYRGINNQRKNLNVHIDDEVFENIYDQFYKENIAQVLGDEVHSLRESYKDAVDVDLLLIETVVNRGMMGEIGDLWNI